MRKNSDLEFFLDNAAAIRQSGIVLPHLDHKLNLMNYVRIADNIAASLTDDMGGQNETVSILDWGCGYGQMTWLLKRRRLEVTSFDIGPDETILPSIPLCADLKVIRTTHPTRLPFPSHSFGAVLSCGVLEHVDECSGIVNAERESLLEINRVLRPNGQFLIYQLPQKHAWQESIVRWLKLGYSHPRRYSGREISTLLRNAGFEVITLKRANFLPKNLTGLPASFKEFYNRFAPSLMAIDKVICALPLINRIAGVLEITAVKR